MIFIVTFIEDDEPLYRRVDYKPDSGSWRKDDVTGEWLVTQSAFNDAENKPSVDRAGLCDNNPVWTQQGDYRNGVVLLLTSEVRAQKDIDTNSKPTIHHLVDIVHRPEGKNYAHAQIEASPSVTSKGTFRRLRASLAFLANKHGWLIKPFGCRD